MSALAPLKGRVAGGACCLEDVLQLGTQLVDSGPVMQAIAYPVKDQEVARGHQATQLLPVTPCLLYTSDAADE